MKWQWHMILIYCVAAAVGWYIGNIVYHVAKIIYYAAQ